jgi:hypothetical protein
LPLQDTTFSTIVTVLFLQPILKILDEGGGISEGQHSNAYKSLLKTKWLTLGGTGLAVVSSTAMYVCLILYILLGGCGKPFYASPYLNIYVLTFNVDSVLNDIGMLLACGVLKNSSWGEALKRRLTGITSGASYNGGVIMVPVSPTPIEASSRFVFESQGSQS